MEIEKEANRGFSMNAILAEVGMTKQAFHQLKKREHKRLDLRSILIKKVKTTRRIHQRMGSRRLHNTARISEVGITKFEKFMSAENLTVPVKRKWIKTTDSRGKMHIYANLTNGLKVHNINELIVGDLTYFMHRKSIYYIFLLTDVYSSRIVGWEVSLDKCTENAYAALDKMLQLRGQDNVKGMIHHTDRGSEYRSHLYINKLQQCEIKISMAKTCIENGHAERRNGQIKNDYLNIIFDGGSIEQMRKALDESVYRYNYLAPQDRLGKRTPVEYEQWLTTIPLSEYPVLDMYDFENLQSNR